MKISGGPPPTPGGQLLSQLALSLAKRHQIVKRRLEINGSSARPPPPDMTTPAKVRVLQGRIAPLAQARPYTGDKKAAHTAHHNPHLQAEKSALLVPTSHPKGTFENKGAPSVHEHIEQRRIAEHLTTLLETRRQGQQLTQGEKAQLVAKKNQEQQRAHRTDLVQRHLQQKSEAALKMLRAEQHQSIVEGNGLLEDQTFGRLGPVATLGIRAETSLAFKRRTAVSKEWILQALERIKIEHRRDLAQKRYEAFLEFLATSRQESLRPEYKESVAQHLINQLFDMKPEAFKSFTVGALAKQQKALSALTQEKPGGPMVQPRQASIFEPAYTQKQHPRHQNYTESMQPHSKDFDQIIAVIAQAIAQEVLTAHLITKDNIITLKSAEEKSKERLLHIKLLKTQLPPEEIRAKLRKFYFERREILTLKERLIAYQEKIKAFDRLTPDDKAIYPIAYSASARPTARAQQIEQEKAIMHLIITLEHKEVAYRHHLEKYEQRRFTRALTLALQFEVSQYLKKHKYD